MNKKQEKLNKIKMKPNEIFTDFVYRTWKDVLEIVESNHKEAANFYKGFDPRTESKAHGTYNRYMSIYYRKKTNPDFIAKEDRIEKSQFVTSVNPVGDRNILKEAITVTTTAKGNISGTVQMLASQDISPEEIYEKLNVNGDLYEISKWNKSIHQVRRLGELYDVQTLRFEVRPRQGVVLSRAFLDELIKEVISDLKKISIPKRTEVKKESGKMVEIPLLDLHLNKLAEDESTGNEYNSKIAEERVMTVIDKIVSENMNTELFVLSVGQDLFNIDNYYKGTTSGTPQDVHTSYENMFRLGLSIYSKIIEKLRTTGAEILVLFVPGNHDQYTSWHLIVALEQMYAGVPKIKFDSSEKIRKYVKWGVNLIGFSHGDKDKNNLAHMMQVEEPKLWAETEFREWHLGHYHTLSANEVGGIVIRRLSSLSGTDRWHKEKGYVSSRIAAQVFVWDKEEGLHSIREIAFKKGK